MGDLRIERLTDRALVRVIAARGATLPSFAPDRALATGPGEALVMRAGVAGEALETELAARLTGLATACDQTEAFALFRLSGPATAEALARLVPIDTEPPAFAPDAAAATILHHMAVLLWREGKSMIIAGASSNAASLDQAIEMAQAGL